MAGRGRLHSPHRRTRRAAEHAPGSRRAGLGVRMLRGDRSAGSARALAGGGPRAPRSPLGGGRAGAPGARLLAERSQPAGREGPPEVRPRGAHTPRDPGRAGDTHLVPWSGQHPRGRSICVGPVLEFEMTCVGDYWVLGQFFWSQRKRGMARLTDQGMTAMKMKIYYAHRSREERTHPIVRITQGSMGKSEADGVGRNVGKSLDSGFCKKKQV
ncbi:uncharacterized protein LOC123651399 [Pipistrellus kuhlii]|uniref:uncharacterized protein LOC123651399 n=1 Tax=Pipistrellus kuhlii TaxID=59472 RepID=UPI001E26FC74|nr:uncharacterized protein LOC123651399 [Pipistrellus kuhlii]